MHVSAHRGEIGTVVQKVTALQLRHHCFLRDPEHDRGHPRKHGKEEDGNSRTLGQVASQTLDNLRVLNDAAGLPLYRPLIGLDKEEITRVARDIGTFGPSTAAVEGCRAVPGKPSTSADPVKIREIEAGLDCRAEIHLSDGK